MSVTADGDATGAVFDDLVGLKQFQLLRLPTQL